jgi:preprotein translocase subunit SecA
VTGALANLEIQLEQSSKSVRDSGVAAENERSETQIEANLDNNVSRPMVRNVKGSIDPNNPATWGKVPRNALCPCGSGKKFKHCHGKI